MFRVFAAIAPSTVLFRSASSKTRNGAFPPSSMDVRRTFCAASAMRRLPIALEPVKETFRSPESFSNGPEIPKAEGEESTFSTTGGAGQLEHGLGEQRPGQHAEVVGPGPGHRGTDPRLPSHRPPLRTRRTRGHDPHRRQETRPHPRRRRLAGGPDAKPGQPPLLGQNLVHPPRLRRGPARRERPDLRRVPYQGPPQPWQPTARQ